MPKPKLSKLSIVLTVTVAAAAFSAWQVRSFHIANEAASDGAAFLSDISGGGGSRGGGPGPRGGMAAMGMGASSPSASESDQPDRSDIRSAQEGAHNMGGPRPGERPDIRTAQGNEATMRPDMRPDRGANDTGSLHADFDVGERLTQGAQDATEVDILHTEIGQVSPTSKAYGRVSAPRRVDVVPDTEGRVTYVAEGLMDGAHVEKGDILLKIDDEEAQLSLREATADRDLAASTLERDRQIVDEAYSQLEFYKEMASLAEAEFDRVQSMVGKGITSTSDVETAQSSLISAKQSLATQEAVVASADASARQSEIALAQAEMALERAENTLEDHTLAAPMSGDFSGTGIYEGQVVSTDSLGEIIDTQDIEVRLELSQSALSRVTDRDGKLLNLDVEIRRPGSDRSVMGHIDRLTITEGDDGYDQSIAIAVVDEPGDYLRTGDFVEAVILENPMENIVMLPVDALASESEVFVLGEDGRLAAVSVDILRRVDEYVVVGPEFADLDVVMDPGSDLEEGVFAVPSSVVEGAES